MKRRRTKSAQNEARQTDPDDPGELIGRRTGRGRAGLARVMAAKPGTDRKAGGEATATARRNVKARAPKATSTLEDSRTKPSRKSTRRSANRAKSGQAKTPATLLARVISPKARVARGGRTPSGR